VGTVHYLSHNVHDSPELAEGTATHGSAYFKSCVIVGR